MQLRLQSLYDTDTDTDIKIRKFKFLYFFDDVIYDIKGTVSVITSDSSLSLRRNCLKSVFLFFLPHHTV